MTTTGSGDPLSRRKVLIPGTQLDVNTVLIDMANKGIFAVSHAEEMVVIFTGADPKPHVRVMTLDEARSFANDVVQTYETLKDDSQIARMEKEFE